MILHKHSCCAVCQSPKFWLDEDDYTGWCEECKKWYLCDIEDMYECSERCVHPTKEEIDGEAPEPSIFVKCQICHAVGGYQHKMSCPISKSGLRFYT